MKIELIAIPDIPMVQPGDDLAKIIIDSLVTSGIRIAENDIVVVAQKLLSKAESRYAYLDEVTVGEAARNLAIDCEKDPRLVQLILDESRKVLRYRPGLIIVEHKCGWVMANAGIDHSNIENVGRDRVLLLPDDIENSTQIIRSSLAKYFGISNLGVIISDSVGRPWRIGTTGMALCVNGVTGVVDRRGESDLFGRTLEVTQVGFADSVAAAAVLVMGEGQEAFPVVLVRGLKWSCITNESQRMVREVEADLFR